MKAGNFFTLLLPLAIATLLSMPAAHAVTRTIYFNASATNRTQDGLSKAATSTCKITVSNPSSVSQTYSITTTATSLDSWTSTTAVQASTGSSASNSCFSSCTLTAGTSATYTYTYTAYPVRPTVTSGKQQLRCSGSITASDVTQAGFLIASGTLTTFVESARMNTDATTGGTATFGGIAIYTQLPIAINRAKPF